MSSTYRICLQHFILCFGIQEVGTIYTHHQKTVIVDADAGNYKRKIVAFVGGLDLCMGRYDTPQHHIFRTLQTVHKDDFHNPNYTVIICFLFMLVLYFSLIFVSEDDC